MKKNILFSCIGIVWMTIFMSSVNAESFINNENVLKSGFNELQKSGFETELIKYSEDSKLELRQMLGVNNGFTYLFNYSINYYRIDVYSIEYGSILQSKIDIMDHAEFIPYFGMKIRAGIYSHQLRTSREEDSIFTEKGDLFFAFIPNMGFHIGVPDFYFTTGFFYQLSNGKIEMPVKLRKHLLDVEYKYNTNHSIGFSIGFLAIQHLYFEVSHGFVLSDSDKNNIQYHSFLLSWMF